MLCCYNAVEGRLIGEDGTESAIEGEGFMRLDRETLERDFHAAMIDLAKKDKAVTGRIPSIFIRMINEHGGYGAAKRLLQSPLQDNLDALLKHSRLDLSMEALVLNQRWETLFTLEERAIAVDRLKTLKLLQQ